jgi:riboflavin-specific deaminase-like protein
VEQVFPRFVADVDATMLYAADERPAGPDRPWVAVNMVASVDGAVTVEGRSGGLSGAGDKTIFFALRSVADVILVGAGTVRAENYGPPRTSPGDQAARVARGQAPLPTIAMVSGRLDLDPSARVFVDSPTRPVILTTTTCDPGRRAALEPVADVLVAGDAHVDPDLALVRLHEREANVVICEGGPTLNGVLLASGVVDELCLTVAPVLVSGDDPRMSRGPTLHPPDALRLDRALVDDGFMFFRYLSVR